MMTCPEFILHCHQFFQGILDPRFGGGIEPVEPENVLSALEKQKRRNPHNLEPGAKALVVPGVDLDDLDVREFPGCPFQNGNQSLAGGARRSKKVYQNGTGNSDSITSLSKSPSPISRI
jgi:hypothetical protein